MICFNLDSKDRFELSSTSKGNQTKWFKDNMYIKADTMGYESISETLVSELLKYIECPYEYIDYFLCDIMEGDFKYTGCYSYNCLNDGEALVSIHRLLKANNKTLSKKYKQLNGKDLVDYVVSEIQSITGLDITDYLGFILKLDWLILNEDRHLNNISIIYNRYTNTYRLAPIFDNGLSLLSDIHCYPIGINNNVNVRKVKSRPFSTSFKKQVSYIDSPLIKIHYNELLRSLDYISNYINTPSYNRAVSILMLNLRTLEGKVWEKV